MNIPENLRGIVFTRNYTAPCLICGTEVTFVESEAQPHRCRIELEELA